MATLSKIEWCDDTGNLWWGCYRVHSGCKNCYAANLAKRYGKDLWDNQYRQFIKSVWGQLAKSNKEAEAEGVRRSVFVGSMMDIFEKPFPLYFSNGEPCLELPIPLDRLPEGEQYNTGHVRDYLFNVLVPLYNWLDFLFLTKRPTNIKKYIPEAWKTSQPENVWLGATVVDTKTAVSVSKAMRWIKGNTFWSVEPLLERIDLMGLERQGLIESPEWIILGGESGPGKRNFDTDWAREWREYARASGVPFFMKQVDKVQPIPEDLLIREFPWS